MGTLGLVTLCCTVAVVVFAMEIRQQAASQALVCVPAPVAVHEGVTHGK